MTTRVPWYVRCTVAAAAWIVPGHRRPSWRRQWSADLEHRYLVGGAAWPAARFALGAVTHALYLRREAMTLRGWLADARHSVRSLTRTPAFTSLTIATLALGIGTAAGVFSIVEALLLRALPIENSDRLVRIYSSNRERGMSRFSVSYPDFLDFGRRGDLFSGATVYSEGARDLSGDGDPERVRVAEVDRSYFQLLGSRLRLGRPFTPDDHASGAPPTAILDESFWERRFGGDHAVLGTTIDLDGIPHTVVGFVATGQGWPASTQVWVPLTWGDSPPDYVMARSNHSWQVLARLNDDVCVAHASAEVRGQAQTLYEGPDIDPRDRGTSAVVVPLGSSDAGDEAGGVFGVLGVSVFLVLLIACLNASGLLLTRVSSRARELSLRVALGAGRFRVSAILLGESLVLALVAGTIGVALAVFALGRLAHSLPSSGGVDLTTIRMNPTVVIGAVAISLVASLMSGLVPAWRASRTPLSEALKEGGSQSGHGSGRSRLRQGLVVAEVALSLALLVSATMTVQAFRQQVDADPGFDTGGLLTFSVRLPAARYGDPALVDAYYRNALDAIERHPSVRSATTASQLPLGRGGVRIHRSFVFEGATPPPEGEEYGASWVEVDPSYFRTLGIPMAEGRAFLETDEAAGPLVAIVNRTMADRMSPEGPMVGRTIRSFWDENLSRTVVGVVDALGVDGLARGREQAMVLVPRAQSVRRSMTFMVRLDEEPAGTVVADIRRNMAAVDDAVALDGMRTLTEAHREDLAGIEFLTLLFTAFGLGALLLAVSGVYGLVSFVVTQRTREIGIRMTMGASHRTVRASVLREAVTLAVAGVLAGSVVAFVLGRALAAVLFGLPVLDPRSFAAVALALGLTVIAASWFPAVRATRIDPVEALRSD